MSPLTDSCSSWQMIHEGFIDESLAQCTHLDHPKNVAIPRCKPPMLQLSPLSRALLAVSKAPCGPAAILSFRMLCSISVVSKGCWGGASHSGTPAQALFAAMGPWQTVRIQELSGRCQLTEKYTTHLAAVLRLECFVYAHQSRHDGFESLDCCCAARSAGLACIQSPGAAKAASLSRRASQTRHTRPRC